MNGFDATILGWLNQFAGRSAVLDTGVLELAGSNLVKGVPLVALLLWYWFGPSAERRRNREIVLATTAACAVAIIAGRLLANGLPYRARPIHEPTFAFVPPLGGAERALRDWSSFPSDHAMLFAAMVTGLVFLSRRIGLLAHVYAIVLIFLPRVYLGWHHPTDILGGMAFGIAFAWALNLAAVRQRIAALPLAWHDRHPRSFYALAFVVAMQIATMFSEVRQLTQGSFASAVRGRPIPATAPRALQPEPADGPLPLREPPPRRADAAGASAIELGAFSD